MLHNSEKSGYEHYITAKFKELDETKGFIYTFQTISWNKEACDLKAGVQKQLQWFTENTEIGKDLFKDGKLEITIYPRNKDDNPCFLITLPKIQNTKQSQNWFLTKIIDPAFPEKLLEVRASLEPIFQEIKPENDILKEEKQELTYTIILCNVIEPREQDQILQTKNILKYIKDSFTKINNISYCITKTNGNELSLNYPNEKHKKNIDLVLLALEIKSAKLVFNKSSKFFFIQTYKIEIVELRNQRVLWTTDKMRNKNTWSALIEWSQGVIKEKFFVLSKLHTSHTLEVIKEKYVYEICYTLYEDCKYKKIVKSFFNEPDNPIQSFIQHNKILLIIPLESIPSKDSIKTDSEDQTNRTVLLENIDKVNKELELFLVFCALHDLLKDLFPANKITIERCQETLNINLPQQFYNERNLTYLFENAGITVKQDEKNNGIKLEIIESGTSHNSPQNLKEKLEKIQDNINLQKNILEELSEQKSKHYRCDVHLADGELFLYPNQEKKEIEICIQMKANQPFDKNIMTYVRNKLCNSEIKFTKIVLIFPSNANMRIRFHAENNSKLRLTNLFQDIESTFEKYFFLEEKINLLKNSLTGILEITQIQAEVEVGIEPKSADQNKPLKISFNSYSEKEIIRIISRLNMIIDDVNMQLCQKTESVQKQQLIYYSNYNNEKLETAIEDFKKEQQENQELKQDIIKILQGKIQQALEKQIKYGIYKLSSEIKEKKLHIKIKSDNIRTPLILSAIKKSNDLTIKNEPHLVTITVDFDSAKLLINNHTNELIKFRQINKNIYKALTSFFIVLTITESIIVPILWKFTKEPKIFIFTKEPKALTLNILGIALGVTLSIIFPWLLYEYKNEKVINNIEIKNKYFVRDAFKYVDKHQDKHNNDSLQTQFNSKQRRVSAEQIQAAHQSFKSLS